MSNVLLFDLNNLAMRNFFTKEIQPDSPNPQYQLWKYEIFSQIYWSIQKFKPVDEIILACDGKDSWRKLLFDRYKGDREKKRRDDIDWDTLFAQLNSFIQDIKQHIPFKVIKVNRAEADDVIAVLCNNIKKHTIIMSNDSDFLQLQSSTTSVYNPTKGEYLWLTEDKDVFLSKLCLKGQSKDNIFNAKTPSDYPEELRKPPLGEKTADKIIENGLNDFLDSKQTINKKYTDVDGNEQIYDVDFYPRGNFDRNQKLINFDNIPKIVVDRILQTYYSYEMPDPGNMYSFFERQGWTSFLESFEITEKVLVKLF